MVILAWQIVRSLVKRENPAAFFFPARMAAALLVGVVAEIALLVTTISAIRSFAATV